MDAVGVDLWLWSLDTTPAYLKTLSGFLAPEEETRAARFVNPAHGNAYRVGRGRLREILGELLGLSPSEVEFTYNAQGKPALPNGPAFNLSHSGGLAALGVCDGDARIGVDIEAFRPVEDDVARRFFAPAEYAALSALSEAEWEAGFFRCWTRKEAIVKGCGPGLSMPLDSFDVTLAPDAPARLTRFDGGRVEDWRLVHLDLGPHMVGAIAVETMGRDVRVIPRGPLMPRGMS